MKTSTHVLPLLTMLTALAFSAGAQDLLESVEKARAGSSAASPDTIMTNPAVSKAVRDTLAESRPAPLKGDGGRSLRGDTYDKFTRQVDEALVPSCWRPDAMKHSPPKIGPIGLGGVLALPFWGWAIVSGKCNK
jgi:hypothetical protein